MCEYSLSEFSVFIEHTRIIRGKERTLLKRQWQHVHMYMYMACLQCACIHIHSLVQIRQSAEHHIRGECMGLNGTASERERADITAQRLPKLASR